MRISATEEHGLRCLMHLAEAHAAGRGTTIAEIATARGMTPAYVAKIIAVLRRGGLVRTARGAHGGLRLARPPEAVTLGEALQVLSGQPVRLRPCVENASARDCGQTDHCNLRDVWRSLNGHILEVLATVTLASLVTSGTAPAPATPSHTEGT